jgi:predicted acylesterase/phospholipase RssA
MDEHKRGNRALSGVALAGGGPLGSIYEVGALVALDEALCGLRLNDCDLFVGVSSGAFFAIIAFFGMGRILLQKWVLGAADWGAEPWPLPPP